MTATSKPKVIKEYEKLPKEIQEQIKTAYPLGFADKLIQFTNKDGLLVSALPFETEDKSYLVKITTEEVKIVYADSDYDDDGDDIKDDLNVEKIDELIDEQPDDDEDDFDEKYADDATYGPGIGKDDDDDDDDDDIDDDDDDDINLDDDDIDSDDDVEIEEKPAKKKKSKK